MLYIWNKILYVKVTVKYVMLLRKEKKKEYGQRYIEVYCHSGLDIMRES